ncbi:UDP-N-acetylglucosamine diphosphorylase [Vibrio cholerae]|nr:putative monosaccharide biosynthesis protein [Vibrio cholerae]GHX40392.1 UDP-N-acetylglucosamine diphosphorylase [Vibrio cholerae]
MIKLIKKLVPLSIKIKLLPIKHKLIDNPRKRKLFLHMQKKHQELLQAIKGKEKIKVVFFAIHKSVWKVDPVFKKMLDDPYFEPVILVCPDIQYGRERMLEELRLCYSYFKDKDYPIINSYDEKNDKWLNLEEIKPDLIFFNNPYDLTRKEYYEDAYLNYLSCYVPYYYMATDHAGDARTIYNTDFMLSMFKIFWPSDYHIQCYKKINLNHINGTSVGYPASEFFLQNNNDLVCPWKRQEYKKKKIIFAPHHTITDDVKSLSSFIFLSDFIKELAIKYSKEVQWSFKPHPFLKPKLYNHEKWGVERTDSYYNFWSDSDFSQLDEGEYNELFYYSDAIIHDSSSFLAEYAFTGKPALYLMEPEKAKSVVNDFGRIFLAHYLVSNKREDIIKFIEGVIAGKDFISADIQLKNYINHYYVERKPSESIIEEIKKSILVNHEK